MFFWLIKMRVNNTSVRFDVMNKWNCMSATFTRLLTHRYVLYLTSLRADFWDIAVTKHMHRLSSLTHDLWTPTICVCHMTGGYHSLYTRSVLTREYQSGIQSAVSHYCSVIMGAMVSQITSLTTIYSTVYSGADQRKHQSSASLAFEGTNDQ